MIKHLEGLRTPAQAERYKIWIEQGGFDLQAAHVSFEHGFYEWACYQSEQSVEKSLKAIIQHGGWKAPKTHKLSVLIGLSNNVNRKFREIKFKFRNLEIFTYISRYPFVIPGQPKSPHEYIKQQDAQNCIDEAKFMVESINNVLKIDGPETYEDTEHIDELDLEKRIEEVKNKIINAISPEKIILFGGYAKGQTHLSTLDILIIAETQLDFVQRIMMIREATKGGLPSVDPVVYTPEEYEAMINQEGNGFLENALSEGRLLYEKSKQ